MLPRALALGLAALGAAAVLVVGVSGAAAAKAPARQAACGFIHSLTMSGPTDPPPRVVIEGERTCGGQLYVKVYRNDVLVISGGNGVGIVNFEHTCVGNAVATWKAVWITGQVDTDIFACG
jgi:hypothetical protein